MKRKLLQASVMVVSLSMAAALCGCGSAEPKLADAPPPAVTVSLPLEETIVYFDQYQGRTKAVKEQEVRALVGGRLEKVMFKEGQMVKDGDLLFEIDPVPYQAALDRALAQKAGAEADLKLANAEYNRIRLLTTKNAASREELDVITGKQAVAAASLTKAEAEIKDAQYKLDNTKIYARVTGRIGNEKINAGNLINVGGGDQLLTTIVSTDPIYVLFDVDENSLLRYRRMSIKEGRNNTTNESHIKDLKIPVFVALGDESGFPHQGVIDFVDNMVNQSTGTIAARAELPNPNGLFTPGMYVRVRVAATDPQKALLVTDRAVGTDQGLKYVLVVDDEDMVRRRDVKLGPLFAGMRVIESGLKKDDRVIVNGLQRVRPDEKVNPTVEPMPTPPDWDEVRKSLDLVKQPTPAAEPMK